MAKLLNRTGLGLMLLLIGGLNLLAQDLATLYRTSEPVNGWLNYSVQTDNRGLYRLTMSGQGYETRPHRYMWSSASWRIGDPNIQVSLLIPKSYEGEIKDIVFRGLEVVHGQETPGEWRTAVTPESAGGWTAVWVGSLLTAALDGAVGIAFSVASFVETVGEADRYEKAVTRYAGEDYRRIPLALPRPDINFCAAEISFRLTRGEPSGGFGLLFKADRRTALGQYQSQFFLVDLARPASSTRVPEPMRGRNWRSPSTGMEFVWIPQMNLWVGKYEVTNAEYRRKKPGHNSGTHRGHDLNGDRQPAVHVSFNDGRAYAEWLTRQDAAALGGARYRLPSEREWMTFAQCGDGREFPWGNRWPPRSGQAGNYRDMTARQRANLEQPVPGYNDGFAVTAPVNALWANPWGLHGVGGNVWETCASDSSGQTFGAWRGAGWDSTGRETLRCATRYPFSGEARTYNTGFRLLLVGP